MAFPGVVNKFGDNVISFTITKQSVLKLKVKECTAS